MFAFQKGRHFKDDLSPTNGDMIFEMVKELFIIFISQYCILKNRDLLLFKIHYVTKLIYTYLVFLNLFSMSYLE